MDNYQLRDLIELRKAAKEQALEWLQGYHPDPVDVSNFIFDKSTDYDDIYQAKLNGIMDALEKNTNERIADRIHSHLYSAFIETTDDE